MMINIALLLLLVVPIAALIWRIVVSKTRQQWIRVGAAGAGMMTAVGAFVKMFSGIMTPAGPLPPLGICRLRQWQRR